MASEHTADEAGGEAIFSSDGLPSLSIPPPPTTGLTADSDEGDAVIEEIIDTVGVFENFVVKSDVERGWGVLSKDGEPSNKVIDIDDPRRKLFRLKAEIDELEAEMMKQTVDREDDIDTDFQAMSNELRSQLEKMGINDDAALETMLRGRQEDLSQVITRDMNKFALSERTDEKREGEKGKIIYELYQSEKGTTSKQNTVEDRLRYLEIAVGSGEGVSLFERVDEAIKLAREVDANEIDKVAAKAKVIR